VKTRHPYTTEPIDYGSPSINLLIRAAEDLESRGAWVLAGEKYVEIASRDSRGTADLNVISRTFARAGVCFEFANQYRLAASSYEQASHVFSTRNIFCAISGEMEGYAAYNYRLAQDYGAAGHALMRAAYYFSQLPAQALSLPYSVGGIPAAAGNYTTAAVCYERASELFAIANDLSWSRFACWQAGVMHMKQGHGYHAYQWFRRALVLCVRTIYTLDPERLRSELPMSEHERREKVNPIELMEPNLLQANRDHQKMNAKIIPERWIPQETARQLRDAFREFAVELSKSGNVIEAAEYTVKFRAIQRRLYWTAGHYGKALLYWMWAVTCGYGQSLGRWITCSCFITLLYAALYGMFSLAKPANQFLDYLYFSIVTITTLGYGDIHPQHNLGRMLASSEAVLGLMMFGFLLTLLNRLVTQD
jgi:tetratricopeptide (TPR) repeat protein